MGDKMKVRHYELRVLHALATGNEVLSFRHLVMLNIMASRESKEKCMVPHCRLITALLRQQGALGPTTTFITKHHRVFKLSGLSEDWSYKLTDRHHILKDMKTKQVLKGVREDIAPEEEEAMEMEEAEEESAPEDEEEGGNEDDQLERDTMEAIIISRRPANFDNWSEENRYHFDRMSPENERNRRHREEQNRQNRAMAFRMEQEIQNRYLGNEQHRQYANFYAGRPYRARPAPVDW